MAKKAQKEIAFTLYQQGKTFAEISAELNVSKASLTRWAREEDWHKNHRKEEIYKTKISEDMHKLASKLLEDVTAEYEDSGTIDAEKFTAFNQLMGRINGAKKYDDETAPPEEKKKITPETIQSIMKELV